MDTRNLTRADVHYIDELCLDANAMDAGGGLDRALQRFAEKHELHLAPGEIFEPSQDEFFEITRLTINEITGGYSNA